MATVDKKIINTIYNDFPKDVQKAIDTAVSTITAARNNNGKVVAIVGSGPNLHEGVTTLIAELMHKDIIHGVITSAAVVSHEMAGTLEKVKRVPASCLSEKPHGISCQYYEANILSDDSLAQYKEELAFDEAYYETLLKSEGDIIIKAAGNLAYPCGLRTEKLAGEILHRAGNEKKTFEEIAGLAADPRTMIGAGAQLHKPVLVSIPQLVGGGKVGLAIGDSIRISERSRRIAGLLDEADVLIESAIALCQEIHDGPFETYTGHGLWTAWQGDWSFSLSNKTIIRIDLDENLRKIWDCERHKSEISHAINNGLPKAKCTGVPFRMEMSGFARHPKSLPIIADIGNVWPVIALKVAENLGVTLDFISHNQASSEGKKMREWIVNNIRPLNFSST
jgi:hypothetical protein